MRKTKLYCIGNICETYRTWKEIFPDIAAYQSIDARMKKRMRFIEAITHIKPSIIYPGEVFNGCEVIGNITRDSKSFAYCDVKCHCGNIFNTRVASLKVKDTISCGCKRGRNKLTHGLSNHPLYSVWASINSRCNNPKAGGYINYGAKGVYVCPDWHQDNPNGCQNFINDMYPNYKKGYQLDKDIRAIPGKPKCYSKDTCCWVSPVNNIRATSFTKLTVKQVKEIKQRLTNGDKQNDIARDYPVSADNISHIKNGDIWKDV